MIIPQNTWYFYPILYRNIMKYIKGFDALRGVSIILVLLTHLGLYDLLPENNFFKERLWLLISGTTGVQIFFTLSGFLITKILLSELSEYQSIKYSFFYKRRFLRLLPPLLIFYFVIAVLMYFEKIQTTFIGYFVSLFYLYNFVPNRYYTGELGHTWSLALEEQYYLMWPFILPFFYRRKTFILLIAGIILTCIAAVYLYPLIPLTEHFKSERWFIPAVAPIMIGSFFAWFIHYYATFSNQYFSSPKSLLSGILLFLFPLYTPILKLSFIVQSIGVSLVLIWLLFNQNSRLTLLLNNSKLSYIGMISYGVYVYQGLFLRTGPSGKLWIQQFPQNIILTFSVAILSYHFIEKPILKLKKRYKR